MWRINCLGSTIINQQLLKTVARLNRSQIRINFISSDSSIINKSKSLSKLKFNPNDYKCIYQFTYINHLRIVSRMKIYQTGASIIFGISSIVMYEMEILTDMMKLAVLNGLMVFALIMLLIMSRTLVRVVGKLYISNDGKHLIVSHLNFFGKRSDAKFLVDDVLPVMSLDELKELFFRLKFKHFDGICLFSESIYLQFDILSLFLRINDCSGCFWEVFRQGGFFEACQSEILIISSFVFL